MSEILEDNNIILENGERVYPSLDENITENNKIIITNKNDQEIEIAKISESGIETTLETLLNGYNTIVEKIVKEEQAIPFETVTKDISSGSSNTKNRVLQEGQDGIKEITYKIKYQNDVEIERTVISEVVLKEPVDKIVQVQTVTTSRAQTTRSTSDTSSSGTVKIYKVTAYCASIACCGKTDGITASGKKATANHTVAAPSNFAFGTKLLINGVEYTVEDRGGAITGNTLDIYVNTTAEAKAWGVRYLPVEVLN